MRFFWTREGGRLFRAEWDQLLLAARGGDVHALGELLDVASEDLRSAAAGVLGRAAKARLPSDDVFGDAMIVVLREIGRLRATNYIGFRYWFASIARNHVRRSISNERERPASRVEEEPDGEKGRDERPPLSPESQAFLRHAVPLLPRPPLGACVLRGGLARAGLTFGFVLERRRAPAARLMHYRAVLRLKDLASARPDMRVCVALRA